MDLAPDVLARHKYKIIHVGQDPDTMPQEIWVSYDYASMYPEVTYPDNYIQLLDKRTNPLYWRSTESV